MRIPSGKTDQKIEFYAESTLGGPKTGLSSFTVYRTRNGGTPTAYTTPTITELDSTNRPGWYSFLIDEDTTIASTSNSELYSVRITATGMLPVTVDVELYDVVLADKPHGGSAAVLTLERMIIASTTTNEPGLKITGNGTGAGLQATGGATGNGFSGFGGATSGSGFAGFGVGVGHGFTGTGASGGAGMLLQGEGTGTGLLALGGSNGDGLGGVGSGVGAGIFGKGGNTYGPGIFADGANFDGGNTQGGPGFQCLGGKDQNGILSSVQEGNGFGLYLLGSGTNSGAWIQGGATAAALVLHGGSTSGNGLTISTTSGAGISISTGGNNDGIDVSGSGSGVGLFIGGGATGSAIELDGGSTSGAGVNIYTTDGHAINLQPLGTGKKGFTITSGADATAVLRWQQMFGATRLITVDDATFTPTTTAFETDQITDDTARYTEQVLYGLSGNNTGVTVPITGYAFTNSKVKLTVEALPAAPSNGDTFIIMGRIEQ